MAQSTPFPGMGYQSTRLCYFTLENGDQPRDMHTCGDKIVAKVHLNPQGNDSLSISNLRVNFKCKARTLKSTGNGQSRRTHKYSVYLFWFSTWIVRNQITINSHQSWDVEFQFPWTAAPHATQARFEPHPAFPHQGGHRLPPTFSHYCSRHEQSVQYYLESVMTRQGRLIEHDDKTVLPLLFSPPLDILDPSPAPHIGMKKVIRRASRLLDPAKRDEHYGFRERTKHMFSSDKDPVAQFAVHASAPTVTCVGDSLPVILHITYDEQASTAPEQPEVTISHVHVRLTDKVRVRVPTDRLFGPSALQGFSQDKIPIKDVAISGGTVVYEGMALHEIVPLQIPPRVGISFATFSIKRDYVLKISAVFQCAGKEYDLTILDNPLTVHPARTLFRPLPEDVLGQAQPLVPQLEGPTGEETLPPYDEIPPKDTK